MRLLGLLECVIHGWVAIFMEVFLSVLAYVCSRPYV